MEPVLAVEPVIISPWLTPSKSPCQVLSDVNRVMSFAFSKSVASAGVILMSKEPVAWTVCFSFWAATLWAATPKANPITAAATATANRTLISSPKCNLQILDPSSNSPHRPEQRASADVFVMGDQRQTFGASGTADDAIGRIAGVVAGELGGQGGDVGGNRQYRDSFDQQVERGFRRAVAANASACQQGGKLPYSDSGNRDPVLPPGAADSGSGWPGKKLRIVYRPKQNMGVQQNQNADSQSSAGSASRSPTISNAPFSLPMKSSFGSSMGTSFGTGLPRLVITSGRLVDCTLSISVRHFALKAAAEISFMDIL